MVPTVALLNVEVKGTARYVARRGQVARARQLARTIACSKLKGDARLEGVAPRGTSRKSIGYIIGPELVGTVASPRRDHVVVERQSVVDRASNEQPPVGLDRIVACALCIARGREMAVVGGARRRFELEGDAGREGETLCGARRQRTAGKLSVLIGTVAPVPSHPPNIDSRRW